MTVLRLAQACFLTLVLILLAMPHAAKAATCESLAALKLPDTTITLAQSVAAGAFEPATNRSKGFDPPHLGARRNSANLLGSHRPTDAP